ncbi:unnamed protein product [Periconia digitata]|uniref:Uncharacterized protein n=1 Tax=Periconia digitata TaxID=1303443 RepID=A0A9W4UR02_9PLEO|nr:unnamed protein product [Periconia digitata]
MRHDLLYTTLLSVRDGVAIHVGKVPAFLHNDDDLPLQNTKYEVHPKSQGYFVTCLYAPATPSSTPRRQTGIAITVDSRYRPWSRRCSIFRTRRLRYYVHNTEKIRYCDEKPLN